MPILEFKEENHTTKTIDFFPIVYKNFVSRFIPNDHHLLDRNLSRSILDKLAYYCYYYCEGLAQHCRMELIYLPN